MVGELQKFEGKRWDSRSSRLDGGKKAYLLPFNRVPEHDIHQDSVTVLVEVCRYIRILLLDGCLLLLSLTRCCR